MAGALNTYDSDETLSHNDRRGALVICNPTLATDDDDTDAAGATLLLSVRLARHMLRGGCATLLLSLRLQRDVLRGGFATLLLSLRLERDVLRREASILSTLPHSSSGGE